MKKITGICYLIDSENIKDTWIDLLDTMEEDDRLLVFYTVNSSHIRCEQVEKIMKKNDGRMSWVQCYEGNNALDFQLVTKLGALIAGHKAREYVIVSKDTGFDAVVKFWGKEGVAIRRIRGAYEEAEQPGQDVKDRSSQTDWILELSLGQPGADQKAEMPGRQVPMEPEAPAQTHMVIEQSSTEWISRMAKSINIANMAVFHNSLVAFYGAEMGDSIYHALKEGGSARSQYKSVYLKDKRQRVRNYVELMLEMEKYDVKDAPDLYRVILKAPRKDLQKLNSLVHKKFGSEKGKQYYMLLKRHINIIWKI